MLKAGDNLCLHVWQSTGNLHKKVSPNGFVTFAFKKTKKRGSEGEESQT